MSVEGASWIISRSKCITLIASLHGKERWDQELFNSNPVMYYRRWHVINTINRGENILLKELAEKLSGKIKGKYTEDNIAYPNFSLLYRDFSQAYCEKCGNIWPKETVKYWVSHMAIMICQNCNKPVRPEANFAGEYANPETVAKLLSDLVFSDLIIVIGKMSCWHLLSYGNAPIVIMGEEAPDCREQELENIRKKATFIRIRPEIALSQLLEKISGK